MNTYYPSGNYYMPQQPIFPQPQGNVYMIQNSLEVANIPTGAGVTIAICQNEGLMYMKAIQNGTPSLVAYKLSPYTEKPTNPEQPSLESRVSQIEEKLANIIGGRKDELPNAVSSAKSATTSWDT